MCGKDYIQIYVNEKPVENEGPDGQITKGFEYDFVEIIVPHGTLDIDAVKANPSAYLDYTAPSKPTIEDLQDGLTALQEIVLGGM